MSLFSALDVANSGLNAESYRLNVVASNLANADTPNYKAIDLDFGAALRGALAGHDQALPLATDNGAQLQPQAQAEPAAAFVAFQAGNSVRLDGNSVNMNREQAAFARNSLQYEADLTFITGRIKTMASAITGN